MSLSTEPARRVVAFHVVGKPEPKGSMRGFISASTRAVVVKSDNPALRAWQRAVYFTARELGVRLFTGPVYVALNFQLARPKSLPRRISEPMRKPDLDKLTRAVLDALTGVLLRDDANVVLLRAAKTFAPSDALPGVDVTVADARELLP